MAPSGAPTSVACSTWSSMGCATVCPIEPRAHPSARSSPPPEHARHRSAASQVLPCTSVPDHYEALERSFLGALPRPTLDRLLVDAVRLDIPAGAVAYRDSE